MGVLRFPSEGFDVIFAIEEDHLNIEDASIRLDAFVTPTFARLDSDGLLIAQSLRLDDPLLIEYLGAVRYVQFLLRASSRGRPGLKRITYRVGSPCPYLLLTEDAKPVDGILFRRVEFMRMEEG